MTWFADLITEAPVSGSDPALAVRLAAVDDPTAYIPVRVVDGAGSFIDDSIGGSHSQNRFDDALSTAGTGFYYIGFAPKTSLSSESVWSIKRIEFTTGDPVHTQWTSLSASWDARVSETYE